MARRNTADFGQKVGGRGSGPGSKGQQQQGKTSLTHETKGTGALMDDNLKALAKGGGVTPNSQPVGKK